MPRTSRPKDEPGEVEEAEAVEAVEPEPVETESVEILADEDDGSVQQTADGYYFVRPGDSAWSASERIYGHPDPHSLRPTVPESPGFTSPGHLIRTPGVPGKVTVVRQGEDATAVLKRMGLTTAGKKNLTRFQDFNGGEGRTLRAGNLVFMPEAH